MPRRKPSLLLLLLPLLPPVVGGGIYCHPEADQDAGRGHQACARRALPLPNSPHLLAGSPEADHQFDK